MRFCGVTQAESDRDRIHRCTVQLDLEDSGVAIFIGDDIITGDRHTGRQIIHGIQREAGAAIGGAAIVIADHKPEGHLTVQICRWEISPGAITVIGDRSIG